MINTSVERIKVVRKIKSHYKRKLAAQKAWRTRRGPYYHVTMKSNNKKTGKIVVTTSSQKTCPDTCPFKHRGCYADGGPLLMHWCKVTDGERGKPFDQFLEELRSIPR